MPLGTARNKNVFRLFVFLPFSCGWHFVKRGWSQMSKMTHQVKTASLSFFIILIFLVGSCFSSFSICCIPVCLFMFGKMRGNGERRSNLWRKFTNGITVYNTNPLAEFSSCDEKCQAYTKFWNHGALVERQNLKGITIPVVCHVLFDNI